MPVKIFYVNFVVSTRIFRVGELKIFVARAL